MEESQKIIVVVVVPVIALVDDHVVTANGLQFALGANRAGVARTIVNGDRAGMVVRVHFHAHLRIVVIVVGKAISGPIEGTVSGVAEIFR